MRIFIITDNKDSYSSINLFEEARKQGAKVFFVSWSSIVFDSKKNKINFNKKIYLKKTDTVIMRSSAESMTPGSLLVEYCKCNQVQLLNANFYLRYQVINKLRQQLIFSNLKIPALETIYGEKVVFSSLKKSLKVPFIAKLANGSLGKQVFRIDSREEFSKFIQERKKDNKLYIFQKFYKIDGDYRVFIVGKNIFGTMKRIAPEGEWRTNMYGSTHERADNKKQVLELAEVFREKTGIEFAGLDIIIDSTGKARIIEINTMACFRVFDESYPEVNIAKKTVEYLIQKNLLLKKQ